MGEPNRKGWRHKPLAQLARIVSGGTPSRYVDEFWLGGNILWVTPTDITNTPGRFLTNTRERITAKGLSSCGTALLPTGSLLMTSRATLGEIRIALEEVCTNQGFKSLVPNANTWGPFLYYQMLRNKGRYATFGTGSTFLEVNKRDTEQFQILVPEDLATQQCIAEILSTVDEAIEATRALIAKTRAIKAGLMHDLFTRGVTADGQLRPPRDEAPRLYKKSPLGWIPKEWDASPYADVTDMITVGIVIQPTQYYVDAGVPAFRSANIREDGINPSDLVFISPASNALLAKSQVRCGDVLTVRTGYPGTSAVVTDEFTNANCVDILISRPAEALNSDFLAAWINSPFGKEQVLRKQGGLAQQHFNVGELRKLIVVLPRPDEQARIVARLRALADRLKREASRVAKYQAIKRGLMHDLLTGRVTVPEAAVDANLKI